MPCDYGGCWAEHKARVGIKSNTLKLFINMIVIRRAVDKNRAYTVIFLKGEEPKWIPTSDYEHARILQIYKQDKPYEGIENDFTDFDINTK